MEKDLKDLLLIDLCARLPYGVKCRTSRKHGLIRIKNCVLDCHWLTEVQNDFYQINPYLLPLSSMTEEQREELVSKHLGYYQVFDGIGRRFFFEKGYEIYDWFNKNHFDYRGLIEKSLAIDATNLGMYK